MKDWDYIKKLGGEGILSRQDVNSLKSQRYRVLWLMLDGKWHTAADIISIAGGSEGLRRLRELREIPNAEIERKRQLTSRNFLYRLRYTRKQKDLFS